MDKYVNNIIEQLSNIEANTIRIMNATDNRKKELVQEMNEITADFDAKIAEDTEKTLEKARKKFNEQKEAELSKLNMETEEALKGMDDLYEKKHSQLTKMIFEQIIRA